MTPRGYLIYFSWTVRPWSVCPRSSKIAILTISPKKANFGYFGDFGDFWHFWAFPGKWVFLGFWAFWEICPKSAFWQKWGKWQKWVFGEMAILPQIATAGGKCEKVEKWDFCDFWGNCENGNSWKM